MQQTKQLQLLTHDLGGGGVNFTFKVLNMELGVHYK